MSNPPSPVETELSPGRCPNCGRPLKFVENLTEGLCPHCEIYVEVLKALSSDEREAPVEPVKRRRDLAMMYLNLEDLADYEEEPAYEEPPGPAPGPDVRPEVPGPEEPPQSPPPKSVPVLPPAPEVPLPLALPPAPPPPPAPEVPPEPPSLPEVPPPPVEESSPAADEMVEPSAETPVPVEEPGPAAEELVEPAVESDAVPEVQTVEEVVEDAGAIEIVEEIVEEPAPPEGLEYEAPPAEEFPVPEPPEAAVFEAPAARAEAKAEPVRKPRRRDRVVFYIGTIHVVLGGVGLLLGSFLHDFFRVPFMGRAYEVFGPLNLTIAFFGGVLLLAGVGAMAAGARAGVVRPRRAVEG